MITRDPETGRMLCAEELEYTHKNQHAAQCWRLRHGFPCAPPDIRHEMQRAAEIIEELTKRIETLTSKGERL